VSTSVLPVSSHMLVIV